MRPKLRLMMERLQDERSRKVIFVSHCVLNENTRYWGGAFRKGCIDEVVDDLQDRGIGIVQMRCPGQAANGILRQKMLLAFGSKASPLRTVLRFALPLAVARMKRIFRLMAKDVSRDLKEYLDLGFDVSGIVLVSGSPFCSVHTKVDLEKSFDYATGLDLESVDRESFNDGMAETWVAGEGYFVTALKGQMQRRGIDVPLIELNIEAERRGELLNLGV